MSISVHKKALPEEESKNKGFSSQQCRFELFFCDIQPQEALFTRRWRLVKKGFSLNTQGEYEMLRLLGTYAEESGISTYW